MSDLPRWSSKSMPLLILGLVVSGVAVPALAQTTFPDVEPNYWAQPFIQALAERDIISGYPDGTFRPEQPLDRDEFAALLRDAFNQNEVRQIPSASSVFNDVASGYWAAPAIEEAYEAGFMSGYSGNAFRPREEVSRVQALVSLVNGLNLESERPQATAPQATAPQATTNQATTNQATAPQATTPQATTNQATTNQATAPQAATNQATTRRATKKPIFLPLAITSMMQPVVMAAAKAVAVPPSNATQSVPSEQSASAGDSTPSVPSNQGASAGDSTPSVGSDKDVSFNRPASVIVSEYYTDAAQIPQYAVDDVAIATRANMVVNYPNLRVLNPNEPLSRGAAAALVYQTLVDQGQVEPLPSNVAASNYIVGRNLTAP